MTSGFITLGDVAARTALIEFLCDKCPRRGIYRTGRLVARHGRDTPVSAVMAIASADCPRRGAVGWYDRCGVRSPTLSEIFPVPPYQADHGRQIGA